MIGLWISATEAYVGLFIVLVVAIAVLICICFGLRINLRYERFWLRVERGRLEIAERRIRELEKFILKQYRRKRAKANNASNIIEKT